MSNFSQFLPGVSKAGDTMTGPLAQAAGTAALPSYTFSGDTNTGMWSPGADILAWSTGGSERLRIDTSGNVGIGVTPSAWGGSLALQFGGNPRIAGQNAITFSGNVYFDGTNWRYLSTNFAALYSLHNNNAGVHSWSTAPSGTAGNVATFTERLQIDNSGNVLVTGSGGLGYGVGSGGTVTQATSKSTAVTLNKPTGQITMNNAALDAGASVIFTLNTSAIVGTTDLVIVNTPGSNNYRVEALNPFAGTVGIRVTNVTGGSLSDALAINFAVIKGATS